ncbi:MAG: response regulator transcription factor [Chloroflexi bacterium]|nr:response regulator transcription factor [Chloroflexota bacterium]
MAGGSSRPGPTILLVEDDAGLSSLVSDWMRLRGYRVWAVGSAADAEQAISDVDPDLIVLDLMLPDGNGLALCASLTQRVRARVIICSATRRKDDAVIGLQLGADDFLRKPYSLEELEARIRLALRRARAQPRQATTRSLGALFIDTARCEATVDGQSLPLTPTEFRLLNLLSLRTPAVVSRQDLAEHVWGSIDDGLIRALDVHMRRLRSKLRAVAPELWLVTRRGFGYQLVDRAVAEVAAPH